MKWQKLFKRWVNTLVTKFDDVTYDEPRIIIPLIYENQLIGIQGRSLGPNSVKYITIMLDEDAPKIYGLDEVDTENNSVKVTGKGNKQRILPIYNKANEKINEYIKKIRPYFSRSNSYSSLLFLNKNSKIITRQYVWRSLKIRGIEKGIIKNITPHMIRHSFATHLLHGGASIRHVQEFLGHSSIESTQIYTKIPNQKLIEDYNIAHPRGNK